MLTSPAVTVRRHLALLVVLALTATLLTPGTAAAAPASSSTCPPPYVTNAQVTVGMTGTGWTVASGTTRQSFNVEVLGVMTNGIAPGRDLIVAEASGSIIDAAGGIWAGMSGSPVYVNHGGQQKLLGAIAYGFTWGASPIAGITPAQDIIDVLSLPIGATTTELPLAEVVTLDLQTRAAVATAEGLSVSQIGREMRPLAVPLSVSGANERTMTHLKEMLDRRGVAAIPYTGSSVSASAAPGSPPTPGSNFAGALSYGDVTFAGVGTTTIVCGDRAVAFGHPFLFGGASTLGANAATAMRVVTGDIFGPFKLATIDGKVGTIDQDRLAGIRARLGVDPASSPIRSTVTSSDTGRSRSGSTDVLLADWMPDLAFVHGLNNADSVFDQMSRGSATLDLTVKGTRQDGGAWRYDRENLFVSNNDIAFESLWEMLGDLYLIQHNPFEPVTITSVDLDLQIGSTVRQLTLGQVLVSLDGGGTYAPARELELEAGQTVAIRVVLQRYQSSETQAVDLSLQVPHDASGFGRILVRGGGSGGPDPFECLWDPEACARGAAGFPGIIDSIQQRPRNDELVAELGLYPDFGVFDEPIDPVDGDGLRVVAEQRVRLDRVVRGAREISALVGGEPVTRAGGWDRLETAVLVSQQAFQPGSVGTVVIARADDPADALAGGPLAAALGGPLLLTGRSEVPGVVFDEIARLGAGEVVLLGGTQAITAAVADELTAAGIAVRRLEGSDRYDTARKIALEVGGDAVYVVQGFDPDPRRGWPDAVAVGGLAARQGRPILLTARGSLPAATHGALEALSPAEATIVGGTAVVSTSVEAAIADHVPAVHRRAGEDRYETARLILDDAVEAGANPLRMFVATGRDWPDALAAGPAVGATGGVLVLVDGRELGRSWATTEFIEGLMGQRVRATLLGGPKAITEETEMVLRSLLGGEGWFPELE